jgi:hypothetical protein
MFGIEKSKKERAKAPAQWKEVTRSTDLEGSDLSGWRGSPSSK